MPQTVTQSTPAQETVSLESFNSLMETVHLLRSPANAAHLAESIAQYRRNCALGYDDVNRH